MPEQSLPETNGTTVLEYSFDTQQAIDQVWRSAMDAAPPKRTAARTGAKGFARWTINETDYWGRLKIDLPKITSSGILDVDWQMRIPQSWLDLGKLPSYPKADANGYQMSWTGQKLFRCFPRKGGHFATLFGRLKKGDVFIRDFGANDQPKQYSKIRPDEWMSYRIRYDFATGTVGLWIAAAGGEFANISTAPGGAGQQIAAVGPIFHASSRDDDDAAGFGHHPPTYVDYGDIRVTAKKA